MKEEEGADRETEGEAGAGAEMIIKKTKKLIKMMMIIRRGDHLGLDHQYHLVHHLLLGQGMMIYT